MALTNDQITAQNFKDFYGQIRPYLNGQIPTFANQFSRSDLYSIDEKIIGSWTDGKPVYSRTFTGTFSSLATVVTDSINLTNNELIHAFGNLYNSVGAAYHIGYSDGSANSRYSGFILVPDGLRVDATGSAASGWVGQPFVVTAYYTKKSDSAIKVGTGTDYSTEEQIIGTWVDGKPLYQKTFVTTTPANNTDTLIVELPSNCIARSFDGYILQAGYNRIPLNTYYDYTNSQYVSTYMQFNPDNGIRMKCENTQWRSCTAVITVLYTKTT